MPNSDIHCLRSTVICSKSVKKCMAVRIPHSGQCLPLGNWGDSFGEGYPGDFACIHYILFLKLGGGQKRRFYYSLCIFCTSEILHSKIFFKKLQARSYLETLAWEGQQPDMGKFLFSVHLAKHSPGSRIQDMLN